MNSKRFPGEPLSIYRLRMKESEKRLKLKLQGKLYWPSLHKGTLTFPKEFK